MVRNFHKRLFLTQEK